MAPLQDRNVPHAEGTTHCADASQLCGEGLACPPSFVKSPAEILILILFQNTSQVLLLQNKGYKSGMLITQKILQLWQWLPIREKGNFSIHSFSLMGSPNISVMMSKASLRKYCYCFPLLLGLYVWKEYLKSSFPKRYKSILIVFMKMTFFYLDPYILLIFNLSC